MEDKETKASTIQNKIEAARRRKEAEQRRLREEKKSKRSASTQGNFFQSKR